MMSLRSIPIEFAELWPSIEEIILNVLHERPFSHEVWQSTFFDIYKVCVAPENLVGPLYDKLKTLLQNHVREIYRKIASSDTQNLLANYHSHWETYKYAYKYLDKLFGYLNNQHIKKIKKPLPENDEICAPGLEVKDLCLYIWDQEMISPLKTQLVQLLMQNIEADRRGLTIHQKVINGTIHSFAEVEAYKKDDNLLLYKESFEKPCLKRTGEYYELEAQRLRQELDCSGYMKKVLQIIDVETMNSTKFLHSSSKDKIISEIRTRMVANHSDFLYQESEKMVFSDNWQDLNLMYRLLKPIDGALKTLIQQVQNRITQLGLDAIKEIKTSTNPSRAFVESFIQVYKKHHYLIATIFNSDQLFVSALDKACSAIINHRFDPHQPCRSPELLAKYCDSLLRKPASNSTQNCGSIIKNLTESEIDEKLSQSIIVFKYIDDKDIFQKFYSKNMARRLIFSQLASLDAEESMINKLKQVCGYEFTAKLQRMFTGIGVSNEQREKFNVYLRQNNIDLGLSFSLYILQNGSWPLGQSSITNIALPEVFSRTVQSFEDYYKSTFNGRVLTWLYHHCTADLKLCYTPKKQYFITMQTFHAAILLLFEDCDELTFGQIADATQLFEDQLVKHLQGFLDLKLLVLADEYSNLSINNNQIINTTTTTNQLPPTSSTSANQESQITGNTNDSSISNKQIKRSDNGSPINSTQYNFTPETRIRLNLDFACKRAKFKIAFVQRESQYQQIREQNESEQTHASIDEDRKLYIQAAIVRVMKSRKVAKHNHLIQEVINVTKSHFIPSIVMIKRCIEVLIEKQYLEKKADSVDEYKYMA